MNSATQTRYRRGDDPLGQGESGKIIHPGRGREKSILCSLLDQPVTGTVSTKTCDWLTGNILYVHQFKFIAQSAGAVEYTDCISAEG